MLVHRRLDSASPSETCVSAREYVANNCCCSTTCAVEPAPHGPPRRCGRDRRRPGRGAWGAAAPGKWRGQPGATARADDRRWRCARTRRPADTSRGGGTLSRLPRCCARRGDGGVRRLAARPRVVPTRAAAPPLAAAAAPSMRASRRAQACSVRRLALSSSGLSRLGLLRLGLLRLAPSRPALSLPGSALA
ncbi:hypothetical protein GALL_348610 [mine drainage metagenome]|uniref:Uncharacterized protein n=1 Tax=mine drainage metagenome TaxID=410659 RepID=A0A1J5QIN4_9ZZZZ